MAYRLTVCIPSLILLRIKIVTSYGERQSSPGSKPIAPVVCSNVTWPVYERTTNILVEDKPAHVEGLSYVKTFSKMLSA